MHEKCEKCIHKNVSYYEKPCVDCIHNIILSGTQDNLEEKKEENQLRGVCAKCKNIEINRNDYPCNECKFILQGNLDHWQSKEEKEEEEEKNCYTCQHRKLEYYEYPCCECVNSDEEKIENRWVPKEQEEDVGASGCCNECKYEEVFALDWPCCNCLNNSGYADLFEAKEGSLLIGTVVRVRVNGKEDVSIYINGEEVVIPKPK